MGWWSETVMGGDDPLDYEIGIYRIAGLSSCDVHGGEKKPVEIKRMLKKALPTILRRRGDAWDAEIRKQVVGVLVMRHGLSPRYKDVKAAINLALEGAKEDEWATENPTRQEYMNKFIKQLEAYDGTPQEPEYEGLFEKFAEAMSSGKTGVINK